MQIYYSLFPFPLIIFSTLSILLYSVPYYFNIPIQIYSPDSVPCPAATPYPYCCNFFFIGNINFNL